VGRFEIANFGSFDCFAECAKIHKVRVWAQNRERPSPTANGTLPQTQKITALILLESHAELCELRDRHDWTNFAFSQSQILASKEKTKLRPTMAQIGLQSDVSAIYGNIN
jgi:hypothetical protein